MIDSDLVLQRAIQKARKDSYYEGENEITLRLLVILASTTKTAIRMFQCYNCGAQFYRDLTFNFPQGDQNVCTSCYLELTTQ